MASNFKPCSVDDCNRNAHWRAGGAARGYCSKHYQMWRIHGDPAGIGTPHHAVSEFLLNVAVPYDGDECLIWPYARSRGYGHIQYEGRHRKAHALVCELVHGPAPTPKHEAAHSCGKGHEGCVNPKHLRWATTLENARDKITHGTVLRGVNVHNAKLDEDKVRLIRSMRETMSYRAIAASFGISTASVCLIVKRKNWAWVD